MGNELKLDQWQEEILAHRGHLVLCTGRQVGKTTIMATKACKYMLSHPKSRIIIVSLTEDQAKLIIVMMLDYLERNYKTLIQKGKNKPTQNRIFLKNGASAIARPVGNTGDAVRGFTGDVLIIDEASRMPELAFTAAKPTLLTTAGEIWMCSTPHGKTGYFYECFVNKANRFKVFHISSEEVINNRPISESWTEKKRTEAIKFLAEEKESMSELQYGQEYLGLFLDELRQYFSDELIARVCQIKRNSYDIYNRTVLMGCDFARFGRDKSTYQFLMVESGKKIKHIESIVKSKISTIQNEQNIVELNKQFNPVKIGIDAGAGTLGVSIYDHLIKDSPVARKIVPMNNRAMALDREGKSKQRLFKEDLYDNLRSMMERGDLLLLDDDEVRLSLKSTQWEFIKTPNGLTKMRIFGEPHTDIVEGLTRAAWLAKEQNLNLFISWM